MDICKIHAVAIETLGLLTSQLSLNSIPADLDSIYYDSFCKIVEHLESKTIKHARSKDLACMVECRWERKCRKYFGKPVRKSMNANLLYLAIQQVDGLLNPRAHCIPLLTPLNP